MSGFKMDDYVDVAERIRVFSDKYPAGSLQSELVYQENPPGWFAKAWAYREPGDQTPGVGHAFEPVPGKTPYTKDSECMNAETAAWGRAIIALGFPSKKIASAQEVRARQEPASPPAQGATRKAAGTDEEPSVPFVPAAPPTAEQLSALFKLVEEKSGDVTATMTGAETAQARGIEVLAKWYATAKAHWDEAPGVSEFAKGAAKAQKTRAAA